MNRILLKFVTMTATLFFSVAGSATTCRADQIEKGIAELTVKINEWFETAALPRALSVGSFTVGKSPNQAVSLQLETSLKKSKPPFAIQDVSSLTLSGRLFKSEEPELRKANPSDRFDSVALRIVASLNKDGSDDPLVKFAINVFGDEALQFLGPTAEFPKDLPEPEKQKQLDQQLGATPEAFLSGVETLSAKDGQFAVEIRVRQGSGASAVSRTPTPVDGRSFVKLAQAEEYIIRLHNKSSEEAAVALTIDGLSMFAFSEDGTGDSFLLIPARKFVDIPGWYITSKKTDVFEVSNYAKSAAASKNLPASGIGVITARFHVSQSGEGKGEEATKRGRQIDQEYKQERRVVGGTRAFVTVRYNREGK